METVRLDIENNCVVILDQTQLPGKEEYLNIRRIEDIYDAIYKLKVRGAPAIGVAAAMGIYVYANDINEEDTEIFLRKFSDGKKYLEASRPTARNLFWALERMEERAVENKELPVKNIKKVLCEEALKIQEEDIASCRKIGEYGLTLLKKNSGILTHCNAGALAASKYGTATAPIYIGNERGYNFKVFADETRPLLQGARLTAFELANEGIDVTLICDDMAGAVMKKGLIDAVIVGCDRVAANGDIANKIGTSMVAAAARRYKIPFYVCAPSSTIDLNTLEGKDIPIEERDGKEITHLWYEKPMAPEGIKTFNPAFDVTERDLITAIITEKGIFAPEKIKDALT